MDDDQLVVKPEAGEEASVSEATPEEPKATEDAEAPTEEPTGDAVEEPQAEPEDKPKKGASQRIRELASGKKAAEQRATFAEDRASSLEAKLAELTGPVGPQEQTAPQYPHVEPGQELTPEQYQQDVTRTANSLVDIKLRQFTAVNRINTEAKEVMGKYPELNPDNDAFNKDLSDSITEATVAYCRANPYSASPKQFVEKLMKPYIRSVTTAVGKESENLAKQVSQSALRPTAISKGEKPFGEKSIAEMEQELGIVQT